MKKFAYPIITGIMFGLGATFLKINLLEFTIDALLKLDVLLSFIPGLVGILLFQISLRHCKASHVSMITAAAAAISAVIGGLFIGEVLMFNELLGMLFIIASISVLVMNESRLNESKFIQ